MSQVSYGKAPRVGRVLRTPQHSFYVKHQPFTIQPFLLAPVLPGETFKNGLLQARAVTSPIKNKLIGWWLEYYFFYVKHRDLVGVSADLQEMMLDLNKDMSGFNDAAYVLNNHFAGAIDWSSLCLDRVVKTYFRDADDTSTYEIDGAPVAAINKDGWWNSAALDDTYVTEDIAVPVVADTDPGTGGDQPGVMVSQMQVAVQMWEFQRAQNMTSLSYEDWLATYGIRTPKVEMHRPELLRYVREWQYPSNTVVPTTGAVTSAVSWSISDRIDKDRFFQEPGFIFGVTIARPKVYLKNIDGSGADMMQSALTWLPALMRDDPWTSMKKHTNAEGPLATVVTDSGGYWVDVKDLLLYGDEFVNVARSATDMNLVALPSADLSNKDYPSETDTDAMFVGSDKTVDQDGVVRLSILGAQVDTTPPASIGTPFSP